MYKYLLMILSVGFSLSAYADDITNQFALQAGNIAGAAEQCGQDVSVLTARSKEAIKAMSSDASDEADADSQFDKAVANMLSNQSTVMRKFSCQDVLTTYNSLPILRSDYEQSVIAVLVAHKQNPSQPISQTAAPAVQSASDSPQVSQATTQPQPVQEQQDPIHQALQNEMNVQPDEEQQYISADDNAYNNSLRKNNSNKNAVNTNAMNNNAANANAVNNNSENNNAQMMAANNNMPFNALPPSDNIATNQQNTYMLNPDAPINPAQN